jgi:hypothetical protein
MWFEFKNNLTTRTITVCLIFLLLAVSIVQAGIAKYQYQLGKLPEFSRVEKAKIERYINYTQYGIYGYRVLFCPSPISSLFFNSTTLTELQAFVDSGVRLKLSRPEVGEHIFQHPSGGQLDYSWYVFFIGGLLGIIYGFRTFRKRDYIKFLLDSYSPATTYISLLGARVILLLSAVFILSSAVFLQLLLNHLALSRQEIVNYAIFSSVLGLIILLSFLLGAAFGISKNATRAVAFLTCIWLLSVFLFPEILNIIIEKKATNIKSRYRHEIEKIKILMDFEKNALAKAQRYTSIVEQDKTEGELAESFWNDQFKRVEKLESEIMEEMRKNIRLYQLLSVLTPATLYKSLNNEISSKGYNAYLAFYDYCLDNRKGFVRHYISKKYYSNYDCVEPFIKEGENLFHSGSSLPQSVFSGILLTFLYLLITTAVSYRLFFKTFRIPRGKAPQIEFNQQNSVLLLCRNEQLKTDFFRFYQHKKDTVCINKFNIMDFKAMVRNMDSIKHVAAIAGASYPKVLKNLAILGIEDLKNIEPNHETIIKIYVAVKTAIDCKYLVLNDFFKRESYRLEETLAGLLMSLAEENKRIIYLTCEMYYPKVSLTEQISVEYFSLFPLRLDKVTLR